MAEILVVDDDRLLRQQKKVLLESEGYSVRVARNGEEALEAVYVRKPDLILLDCMMPRRNGFSVCEEVRRVDPLLPIIALTAYDGESNELRARAAGADDFFAKDVADEVILAAIRRALSRAKASDSAKAAADQYRLGDVTVDLARMTLLGPGVDERLTQTEAEILKVLLSERGKVHSPEELAERIHGEDYFGFGALRSHIHNLKVKLGRVGNLIVCDRFAGYRIVER